MNTAFTSSKNFKARRLAITVVAVLAVAFLTITVSEGASAKAHESGTLVFSSMESEIDSVPGSGIASTSTDSSLEGPLMASDPTFVVTDSLKGPLTDSTTTGSSLKGPLS